MSIFGRLAAQMRARGTAEPHNAHPEPTSTAANNGDARDANTCCVNASHADGTRPDAADAKVSPCERDLSTALARAAAAGTPLARYALLYSGDVQGVGFRWTHQALAREHGLVGWARNLEDGTVSLELQGAPETVRGHLARIHDHYRRFGNRIWLESARELARAEHERDFDVRW